MFHIIHTIVLLNKIFEMILINIDRYNDFSLNIFQRPVFPWEEFFL